MTKYPRQNVTVECAGCGVTAPSTKAQTMKHALLPEGWAQGGGIVIKTGLVVYWCPACFASGKTEHQQFRDPDGIRVSR